MKNYVVFVPAENRDDNPYINDEGYLSTTDITTFNLKDAKFKAMRFGGTIHESFVNEKPELTFYSDYAIKNNKLYIIHETEDNRVHTTLLGKVKEGIDRVKEFIESDKKILIII